MKFRKKPVVINAIEWTGENHREMWNFLEDKDDEYMVTSGKNFYMNHAVVKGGLIIKTLEGEHLASIGDYIVKGIKGEFYPCKPDVFVETYEKVVDELTIDDLKDLAKQSYKFTNAQLFEVEKLFDNETAHIFSAMRVLGCVEAFDDADNSMGHRIFQDLFKTYESYRTISAKCSKMREEDKK